MWQNREVKLEVWRQQRHGEVLHKCPVFLMEQKEILLYHYSGLHELSHSTFILWGIDTGIILPSLAFNLFSLLFITTVCSVLVQKDRSHSYSFLFASLQIENCNNHRYILFNIIKKDQLDASVRRHLFTATSNSTCFGRHSAHLHEFQKLYLLPLV
jgi:hypothetical protein